MRLIIVLLAGIVLGWIAGNLYPAPQAWLAALHLDAVEGRLGGDAQPQTSTTPLPPDNGTLAPAATPTAPGRSSARQVNQQTLNQYRAWIDEARAAHPYDDSADRMYAVMMCESNGRADIVNPAGPYSGLFQYSTSLWNGAWNQYRNQSVLDPRAQIFATALAWHNHMQRQWGCYSQPH